MATAPTYYDPIVPIRRISLAEFRHQENQDLYLAARIQSTLRVRRAYTARIQRVHTSPATPANPTPLVSKKKIQESQKRKIGQDVTGGISTNIIPDAYANGQVSSFSADVAAYADMALLSQSNAAFTESIMGDINPTMDFYYGLGHCSPAENQSDNASSAYGTSSSVHTGPTEP